jgi:hypothetical protein
VWNIFHELGPTYVCRACRMDEVAFYDLHRKLHKHMTKKRRNNKKKTAKNGVISTILHLSVTIRYFAGGNPYDISIAHGISHTEVFRSVWRVVDAVNKCPALSFSFPANHDKQEEIAFGFLARSEAGFSHCVGCINGMLLWIDGPTEADCEIAAVKPKKFFCGQKKKFGLNLQAVCDAKGRFIDVCIGHPGSTSDYLAFCTSSLKYKLEHPGFLKRGLCLFGDNAYVNTNYMATPFKACYSGEKDDYNFYHSQV